MPFLVDGKIGTRWRAWGAANGPFGQPLGPEEDVAGQNGRRQRFEYGEIAWSPDQDMVVSVYRLRNEALFEWEETGFGYDFFRYDISYNGVSQGQAAFRARVPTQRWVRLQGFGEYAFIVKGCIKIVAQERCDQGFTIPVRVKLEKLTAQPPKDLQFAVTGLIEERWHELGAWEGSLGRPTAAEEIRANDVRVQSFEGGTITTAPAFGPQMVVAAYQRHDFIAFNTIEVNWGGADKAYNAFRVDMYAGGQKVSEEVVFFSDLNIEWARPGIGSGQFVLRDAANKARERNFAVFIVPIITNRFPPSSLEFPPGTLTPDPPPPGSTPAVSVNLKLGDIDVRLEPPALGGPPARAFASHVPRVNAIAKHYARTRPLRVGFEEGLLHQNAMPDAIATEDDAIQLFAHLHMASIDRDFRATGELPSRILALVKLRQLLPGRMGTSIQELGLPGDYDMALKGLMFIVYRYRELLNDEIRSFILQNLVPDSLFGGHDVKVEFIHLVIDLGNVEDVPIDFSETENHLLMIETSRYLVNQLQFERTGDQKYFNGNKDTKGNGLRDWLLDHLQRLAKHDFLEFNSRPYNRLSVHALLNLYEFALDDKVRTASQIVLDYIFVKFAISSNRLRRITPFRRLKENTNRPDKINDLILDAKGGDELTGFFLMYAGLTDGAGKPAEWFPDPRTFNALIAGLSTYRPPVAAYILALTEYPPVLHRFYHGTRPQLHSSPDVADGGVEIYYKSPSFLLTAGGMFLNSGYGRDELPFSNFKQVAIAQSTTLIPTRIDVKFADLIRFDPYPAGGSAKDERLAVNTGVDRGFACGANLRLGHIEVAGQAGPWFFSDLSHLGFYVVVYRTPAASAEMLDPAPESLGFVYAMEAPKQGGVMSFEEFKTRTLERNITLPRELDFSEVHDFHSPDDKRFRFVFNQRTPTTYTPRVFPLHEANPLEDFTSLPLVDGPYLKSRGHDGFIEVRYPECDTPLILDYSHPLNPERSDNDLACPKPLIERSQALRQVALQLLALSQQLAIEAKQVDAIMAALAAVDVLRGFQPPATEQTAYLTLFGQSLLTVTQRLIEAQRIDEVSAPALETIQVYRQAAESGADVMSTGIANNLLVLSALVAGVGLSSESAAAAQAAVDVLRGFQPPATEQTAYLTLFGQSLLTVTQRLIEAQRIDEVSAPALETIQVYRQAAESGADVMSTGIANNLLVLSALVAGVGLSSESAAAAQAAVDVLRGFQPPATEQTAYLTLFGQSLLTVTQRLIEAQRIDEVSAPALETIQVYRQAAESGADVMSTGIANNLLVLSALVAGVGLSSESAAAAQAAVDVLRGFQPPATEQTAYLTLFGQSLLTVTQRLIEAQRIDEVSAPALETIQVYRQAAESGADVMSTGIANNLLVLSALVAGVGLSSESAAAAQAAVDVLRGFQPPATEQTAYLTLFGQSLLTVTQRLIEAQRIDEVSAPALETIQVYRQAAESGADVMSTGIANNLLVLSALVAGVGLSNESAAAAQAAAEIRP